MATKRSKTPPPPHRMSATDTERLDTFMPELADQELGHLHAEASGSFRAGKKRHLVINPGGTFYDFVTGNAGRGAIKLLCFLHQCKQDGAVLIAETFLKDNPGTGSLSSSVAADEDAETAEEDLVRTTAINNEWQAAQPIDGTPAEVYLKARGLDPDPEDRKVLRQIAHKLTGSTIMVAAITAENGDIVALQETYLTATGKKADVLAVRRTMRGPHDWNTRGLVRFGNPRAKKVHLCEGVEDALSVRAAGADCVYALTGLARLPRINLPAHVEEIVVVTDDDGDGTPASEMLWRGIVGLLGNTDSRVNVSLTPKPAYAATDLAIKLKDVNDLLQHDAKAVKELLASATSQPRGLSDGTIDVILDAMSRLDAIRWQRARERIVKLLGWKQVVALDKERAKRIATRAATDEMDGGEVYPVVVPWEEPVTDLGAVLDELVEELGRYMSASLLFLNTTALWSVLAHLLQRDDLGINISPRLAIQSPDKRCGKTTLLEAISCVVPKPDMLTSLTPAALFRTADEFRPTFLIDEADILMRKDAAGDLLMILNAGYRRKGANVVRMEKRADGGFNRVRFRTFTGMAFAGIKKLPDTLQDRSIVVSLQRASAGELKAHLTDGDSAVLNNICRKLTRWRADLADLPKIDRPPALANRLGDNWYPMRQIAALAGGEWPARAMAAALGDADTDVSDGQSALESLLDAIWRVFHATKKVRIHTRDLVGELLAMDEGKWKEAYRGGNISEYYIRSHLKGVIPPSAEARADRRWRKGGPPYWGYHVLHLEDAWKHYLNGRGLPVEIKDTHAQAPSKTGTSSDTSDTEAGNVDISNSLPVSDSVSDTSRPSDTAPPDTAPSDTAASNTVSDTSVSDDQNLSDTASSTPFCKENQNVNGSVSDVSDEDGVLDGGRARGFPRGARGRRYRQDGDGEARQ